jgi:putative DNA primase/helicase
MSTEEPDSPASKVGGDADDTGRKRCDSKYIEDPDFGGSVEAVQKHYEHVRPVYEAFSDLDGAPTTGFFGNSGWYRKRHRSNDDGEAVVYRRAYTFEKDYDRLIRDIKRDENDSSWRSAYNIASWKERRAVYEGVEKRRSCELGQGDGLAGYADMRGFPLWVDLDLADNNDGQDGPNYKRRRGNLPDDVIDAVECAYRAYTEEFADILGTSPERIAVFDSGGGGYLYTPAAVTVPIAEWCDGKEDGLGAAQEFIFEELRDRFFAYGTGTSVRKEAEDYGFKGIETRVNERIDGADEYLDPDWMQNRNRQSKAPLAIHGDHDIVVTPARPVGESDGIEYRPTLVSDVDDALIKHTAREAEKIVSVPDRDVLEEWTEEFVSTLFPEHSGESWRRTLEEFLNEIRTRKRKQLHREARDNHRQRQRLKEKIDDSEDTDGQRDTAGLLTEIEVTPVKKDVYDVLDGATKKGATFTSRAEVHEWWRDEDDELIVDIRDVIKEYAVEDESDWKTADRGHEITFNPCWRGSGSGESCAVKWVSDYDDDPTDPSVGNSFLDNSCNGSGGPAKIYALGTGILPADDDPDEADEQNAAAEPLTGKLWADAVEGLRADGYPIPIYIPEAGSPRGDGGETYEQTPLWALRKAAVALGVCDQDDFTEHETEDGETYLGFDEATYNAVLRALEEEGIDHGRDRIDVRSVYLDVDLENYIEEGDPYTDPDRMLEASLRARKEGAVSEYAAPPKLALIPLKRDVLGQEPKRDMNSGTKKLLEDLFHELTVDELNDVLDG